MRDGLHASAGLAQGKSWLAKWLGGWRMSHDSLSALLEGEVNNSKSVPDHHRVLRPLLVADNLIILIHR